VLSAEGVQLMHTPPSGIDSDYAMGWTVPGPDAGVARLEHTGVLSTFFAEQVLLPDEGYGIAVLFDGSYALADTAGVADRVAALLAGDQPAGSFPPPSPSRSPSPSSPPPPWCGAAAHSCAGTPGEGATCGFRGGAWHRGCSGCCCPPRCWPGFRP
jgi:hypothetical protein